MGRWLLLLLGLIIAGALPALGQGSASSGSGVSYVSTAPSGACTAGSIMQVLTTGAGTVYACQSISAGAGTWTALGSTGSTGTVTNVTVQGTASQITVTGGCAITTTGTCVLSLPSAITLPGSLSLPGQLTSTETTGTAPFVVASTTVVANLNVSSLLGATWVSPGAIGSTTASTGAFTTLSASSTVSGTGFSTYLASPPAIGGTVAAAGTFSALTDTAMTGGPFCVHETSGVFSATTADCGVGGGTFSGLNTTGANGTNTNANPIAISPGSALGGSTSDFSVLGATSDTNTATVVNIDTPSGSQQNSFRVGIDGVSQLQICWQAGPQGETVFGSAVACSGIYTTSYAKNIFQSVTGVHTLIRGWQGSASQTGPFVQLNTATVAGTGFAFLQGWTGVSGTDTYHTGGTESLVIQGDGSYIMGGCGAGTFLKADGSGCAVPSGSGTVGSGTANQITYYATTGAAVAGDAAFTDNGTTVATTDSGGFTANSFNSPSTTAPFLATSPVPSGACTPIASTSLITVSNDGNFYVSNNGGTCYQLDTTNTVIPTTNGGTGQNFGASTGVLQLASGTASVSTALANGTTATTQSAADNTTKVATDAFVITNSITNPCSAAAIGSIIYQGSSSVQCLAAPTGPVGVPNIISTIPGSAPSYGPAGITVNAQSTSSYSLGVTDRGSVIQTTNNTTSTGLSVPSPTSTGYNQSYFFQWVNTGSVVGTATTTSSNVNGNATLKMVGAVSGHNPEASGWVNDGSQWWAWTSMPSDANGQLAAEAIANGSIVNAALAHAATTVQGQTCTLGSPCNINSVTTAHGVALNEGASTQLGGTAAGTSNTVLHGNTGADPTFSAVSLTADVTGVLPFANMAQMFVTNAQTSTYQVVAADFLGCKTIPVSSATFTITLVASGSQPASGQCVWIINYGTGTPTIARSGQNINGAASNLTLAAGSASAPTGAFVVSDGTNYEAQVFGSGSGGGAVSSVSNSDGTITISPTTGSVVASLNLSHANTWAAIQTITNSDLALLGSSTGATTFTSANASATNYTATFPANTGTIGELNLAQTWTAAQALGSSTATTQSQLDGSTKLATTLYTDTAVSNAIAGVNPAVAVLAASTANLTGTYVQVGGGVGDTFTITATGAFTLDGVALSTIGQRVLFKNQSTAAQNGVYTVTVAGTTGVSAVFTRALDYDTVSDVNNTGSIPVQSGTANSTTSWLLTSQVTSIGSSGSSLTYAQFSLNPTNLVTASSPGVGIAHFAGSTQAVTSSLIVAADITNNTITGTQLASSLALTTPNIGAATGTSLLVTGILDGTVPVTKTTGTTATLGAATYQSGYTVNQEATAGTGVTYTLPATVTGAQYCVANSGTTGVVNTGVLTVYPAASSFVILNGVVNTVGGGGTHGVASGGAAGDSACFVAIDSTHWQVFPGLGTWTEN